jgi:type IV pilus assembly protein PilX
MSKAMSNLIHPLTSSEKHFVKPISVLANRQQGVVLVVSLIMLLLMTLIGITGMQTTSLEEKMAGNMRDRNLAFQAAESALKAGETFLATTALAALPAFDCTNGFYPQSGTGCAAATPIWDNSNWDANDSQPYVGVLANLATNPRYIIEDMGSRNAGGVDLQVYRITAHATGGTLDAEVLLQSIYEIPI